jgi:hypothetical protein
LSNDETGYRKVGYHIYDAETKNSTPIDLLQEKITEDKYQLFRHSIQSFAKDKNTLVIYFSYINKLKIIDLASMQTKVTLSVYGKPVKTSSLKPNSSDNVIIYNHIELKDNRIYALYMAQTIDDIIYRPKAVEIHVYSADGAPICNLKVAEHIRFIAVDDIHQQMYGITVDDEIFRYDIGNIQGLFVE